MATFAEFIESSSSQTLINNIAAHLGLDPDDIFVNSLQEGSVEGSLTVNTDGESDAQDLSSELQNTDLGQASGMQVVSSSVGVYYDDDEVEGGSSSE